MSLGAFIDVAIGLVLMYLVLSVFCTAINEVIATLFQLRASSLQSAIQELIDHKELLARFYDHGLIDSTHRVSAGPVHKALRALSKDRPSYLPSKVFAMALLGSLDPQKPLPVLSDVETAIAQLPESNIKDVLLAYLGSAKGDLAKFRDEIAKWFDQSMDRLAGQYKRRLRFYTFWVGAALVAALNADTFHVADALWKDGTLRESIVRAAEHTVAAGAPNASAGGQDLNAALANLSKAEEAARPLPLGWTDAQKKALSSLNAWILKAAGCLLTIFALTLGAPFWFDVLSKFMRVRGAGDKPERTNKDQ